MSPRLGDLTCDRTVLLVELNLGHPLLDFGQPYVLRSALPRRPGSISVNAQDASVRDDPHAERLRRGSQCRFKRGIRDQDHRLAFHTFLIFRHMEVQPVLQPANH